MASIAGVAGVWASIVSQFVDGARRRTPRTAFATFAFFVESDSRGASR